MKKNILIISILLFLAGIYLPGCRTLHPENEGESTQPWATPEKWQETQGIPGFSGTRGDTDY